MSKEYVLKGDELQLVKDIISDYGFEYSLKRSSDEVAAFGEKLNEA